MKALKLHNFLSMERPILMTALEITAAIVISVAAVLTSWASFQAALWDGDQQAYYARASRARTAATRLATEAGQYETADLLMFQQWLNAAARDEPRLKDFYRERFRPEFAIAFNSWMETTPLVGSAASTTPFAMPQYHLSRLWESEGLQKAADRYFNQGERANDVSDAFERTNVLFAIALFFGGIGQTFKSPFVKAILLGLAVISCTFSAMQLAQLPTQTLKHI
jgi:hypothetical protein